MSLRPVFLALATAMLVATPLLAFGPHLPWEEALSAGERALKEGRQEEARTAFRKARDAAKSMGDEDLHLARVLDRIGMGKVALGKGREAAQDLEDALTIRERLLPPDSLELARSLQHVGALHDAQGRSESAEQLLRRALKIRSHPSSDEERRDLAATRISLAGLFWREKRHGEGDRFEEDALEGLTALLGPRSRELGLIWRNLGRTHAMGERPERARRAFRRSLEILEGAVGKRHPDLLSPLEDLMRLDADGGRFPQARSLGERLIELGRSLFGSDDSRVARMMLRVADVEIQAGMRDRARRRVREALILYRRIFGKDSPRVARIEGNYAGLLADVTSARRPKDEKRGPAPRETLLLAQRLRARGLAALEEGNHELSRRLLDRAHRLLAPYEACEGERFLILYGQALLAGKSDRLREAWSCYDEALRSYEEAFGPDDAALADFLDSFADLESRLEHGDVAAELRARASVLRTEIRPGSQRVEAVLRIRSWLALSVRSWTDGQEEKAEHLLRCARLLARRAELPVLEADSSRELAFLSVRRGRWDEAESRLACAEADLRRAYGEKSAELCRFLRDSERALWLRPKGGLRGARASLAAGRRAWEAGDKTRPALVQVLTPWLRRAETERKEGRWERGLLFATAAEELAMEQAQTGLKLTASLLRARILADRGQRIDADALFRKTAEGFARVDGLPSPGWTYARILRRESLPDTTVLTGPAPVPSAKSEMGRQWLDLATVMSFEDPERCRSAFESLRRSSASPADSERLATIAVLRELLRTEGRPSSSKDDELSVVPPTGSDGS